jgi:hypothetical protein
VTALTKKQFRFVLGAYCAFILFVTCYSRITSVRTPPTLDTLEHVKQSFGMGWLSDQDFAVFMIWLLSTILVAHLVGVLFLFLLWRQGLYIFLFAICARLSLYWFYVPRERSYPGHGGINLAELLVELAILAVASFEPAKHLFQRQREA